MLGFLQQDLLLQKKDLIHNAILFFALSYLFKDNWSLTAWLLVLQSMSMLVGGIVEDMKSNFSAYAVGLPNGRKRIVLSKYVLYLLYSLIVFLINTLLRVIVSEKTNLFWQDTVSILFAMFVTSMLIISILFPIIFYSGTMKGLLGFYILLVLFIALVVLRYTKWNIPFYDFFVFRALPHQVFLIVIAFIGFLISYFLSLRIIKEKEF